MTHDILKCSTCDAQIDSRVGTLPVTVGTLSFMQSWSTSRCIMERCHLLLWALLELPLVAGALPMQSLDGGSVSRSRQELLKLAQRMRAA